MTHPEPVVVQDSGVPEVEQESEELSSEEQDRQRTSGCAGCTYLPGPDYGVRVSSSPTCPIHGATTPAEERTGVSDVQHAVLGEVAALREDLAPMREMAWTERHNGIGPTLMLQIDARLDRIEQWARGGQR